jgi:acyl-CoA thioesterase YciA
MIKRLPRNQSRQGKTAGLPGHKADGSPARNGNARPLLRPAPHERNPAAAERVEGLQPAIRVVMMPRDANYLGTIFGGVILSSLDLAGAVEAHRHTDNKLVTVAMHEVRFIAPVLVGDLVSFYTEVVKIGRTSITVRVTVEARRAQAPHQTVRVTQAEVVYVAVDEGGRAVPVQR